MSAIKTLLINEAAAQHAAHAQYDGYWDGWTVGQLTRNVKSRGALVGVKDDFVLLDPDSFTTPESPDVIAGLRAAGMVTVYLPRHYAGGTNTSIKARDVKVLR